MYLELWFLVYESSLYMYSDESNWSFALGSSSSTSLQFQLQQHRLPRSKYSFNSLLGNILSPPQLSSHHNFPWALPHLIHNHGCKVPVHLIDLGDGLHDGADLLLPLLNHDGALLHHCHLLGGEALHRETGRGPQLLITTGSRNCRSCFDLERRQLRLKLKVWSC